MLQSNTMNPRFRFQQKKPNLLLLTIAALALWPDSVARGERHLSVYYKQLGSLPGGVTQAVAVNGNGQVTGSSGSDSTVLGMHPFLSDRSGVVTNLNDPFGYTDTFGLNASGQVAGTGCYFETQACSERIYRYTPGIGVENLGSLAGPYGYASGINNLGDVVGSWRYSDAEWWFRAYIYSDDGGLQDLGALEGTESWAMGINDARQVVGRSWVGAVTHACRWDNGAIKDLGSLGFSSSGLAINSSGVVVGMTYSNATQRNTGFIYTDAGGMQEIPMPDGTEEAEASVINDAGQVAGTFTTADREVRIFMYSADGGFHDFGPTAAVIGSVRAINKRGEIVGQLINQNYLPSGFLASLERGLVDLNDVVSPPTPWWIEDALDINDSGLMVFSGYDINHYSSAVAWPQLAADMNCDGSVNQFDIQGFVAAMGSPASYAAQYPNCDPRNADMNQDGSVNQFDIQGFVEEVGA